MYRGNRPMGDCMYYFEEFCAKRVRVYWLYGFAFVTAMIIDFSSLSKQYTGSTSIYFMLNIILKPGSIILLRTHIAAQLRHSYSNY